MKYAHWTTAELALLARLHVGRKPSLKELAAALPRHPASSIWKIAYQRGLRRRAPNRWLVIAAAHAAKKSAPAVPGKP